MRALIVKILIFLFAPLSLLAQYYHPFQNFDDDVDRVKGYSNFFGGNHGVMREGQFDSVAYDTENTRTGYGRALRIDYGPLYDWSMYVESFNRKYLDSTSCFNLNDLFPDYVSPQFKARKIDSIAFYCKLKADNPLTIKIELKDTLKRGSQYSIVVNPSPAWQRFSIGLEEFEGTFDPTIAKFLGVTVANYPDNLSESGQLYLDDFYLVEKDYTKPAFGNENDLLEYLNEVNFRHFWMAVEPKSKFALDRHTYEDLISVDAIGFQLASYVVAHKNNWVERSQIKNRIKHILDCLVNVCKHATDTTQVINNSLDFATIHGNWAHFLDDSSLARKDRKTEFSIFTNALLLSGALVCQEYFKDDSEIYNLVDNLYKMTDWNFFYIEDQKLMYYSWNPDSVLINNGYSKYYTDWFSEELDLVFLLGISQPNQQNRLPANPFYSPGYQKPVCDIWPDKYIFSAPGSNFTYYFLQMYAKFTELEQTGDRVFPRFLNTKNALLADLAFCQIGNSTFDYNLYDRRVFGTTACEGPDSAGEGVSNYHAYGYPCRKDRNNVPNGTIAIYGSGSAILFIPEASISCLKYYYEELDTSMYSNYGYNFWSPIFGFPDAFHLYPEKANDPLLYGLDFRGPWLSVPRFGIDVGPMLLNIDSYLSENVTNTLSIRDLFSKHPYITPNMAQFDTIPTNILDYCLLGDPDMDSTISSDDALCAFHIYLNGGLPENGECFNECAIRAADANCDGIVSSGDALVIYKASLNALEPPLECPSVAALALNKPDCAMELSPEQINNHQEGELTVAIKIDHPKGISAFGFDLGFPIKSFSVVKVSTANLTRDWEVLDGQANLDGVITIGGFSPWPIDKNEPDTLVTITFKAEKNVVDAGELWLFNLRDDVAQAKTKSLIFNRSESNIPKSEDRNIPKAYALKQNYPNPFNPETSIQFQLPVDSDIELAIYNVLGQKIRSLVSTRKKAGYCTVEWDGKNEEGICVSSGIYLYKLRANNFTQIRKMLLMR